MTEQDYIAFFYLLWNHAENEVVEFKRAENGFDVDDLVNTELDSRLSQRRASPKEQPRTESAFDWIHSKRDVF